MEEMKMKAREIATLLKVLANENRLLIYVHTESKLGNLSRRFMSLNFMDKPAEKGPKL